MNKPKIALLHYTCPPVVGGVEKVMKEQASLFLSKGHDVKIIAGKGEQFTTAFPITINPVFSSRNPDVDTSLQKLSSGNSDHFYQLIDIAHEDLVKEVLSYDVLIAHNVMTMPYNLPLTYALHKLIDDDLIRVISWNHDSIFFYPDCPDQYHAEPWTVLKTKNPHIQYICISQARYEQFCSLYQTKRKITVIPNGIDPPGFFQLTPETKKVIYEQKLYNADLVMVQPSRLIPRKNFELGLRVAGALKKMNVEIRYLITGAYDTHEAKNVAYYRKLRNMAKDLNINNEVIFIAEYRLSDGKRIVPNQTFIRDLYFIADILFMPSLAEGFGLPLLEAGMIKLPIVCSEIPPFLEIGSDYICTFSLHDSPDHIADNVMQFLDMCPTHNMYRNVVQNYTWESIYKNYMLSLFSMIEYGDEELPEAMVVDFHSESSHSYNGSS